MLQTVVALARGAETTFARTRTGHALEAKPGDQAARTWAFATAATEAV